MTNQAIIYYRNADQAFDDAIRNAGELSADPTADTYAAHYMYIGTEMMLADRVEIDLFKRIDTREYLRVQYDMN